MKTIVNAGRAVIAAAALVVTMSSAQAVPVLVDNWLVHDPVENGFHAFTSPTVIDDVFTFSLPGSFDAFADAVSLEFQANRDISGGMVALFASNGDANYLNDGVAIASFLFDAVNGANFLGLAAGDYYYRVTGSAVGSLGGSYAISSQITAIPVPAALPLLAAGFGLIGLMASRRKRKTGIAA